MMRWNHCLPAGWSPVGTRAAQGLWTLVVCGLLGSAALAGETVYSSKARFRIPYQLDAAEIQRLNATEIQLHVTTDGGKNWRHVDSVPPVAGKFTFEAAQDREYWFSVRTISENGRHHPTGPLTAGLKVSVDTSLPALELSLSEIAPGEVGLRWIATDEHLEAESLVLEWLNSQSEWEAIPVAPAAGGETSWSAPHGETVTVRGRVRDLAGNEATVQSELQMSGSGPVPAPEAPARQSRQPIAEGPQPAVPSPTGDPFALQRSEQEPGATSGPAVPNTLPLINPGSGDFSQFVSQHSATPPVQAEPVPDPSTAGATSDTVTAPVASQSTDQQRPNVRRVNSTSFQIGYVLEDVGPSGVGSVDLYLTEDGGRRWFHYGSDDDGSSPFAVTVPQDGTYGFAIRVRSGAGLAQDPPQPGDPAELTIAVDSQPPEATLLPVKQGDREHPGRLVIEWTVRDAELADHPVSLFYATAPEGPWQAISEQEPNSGRHVWAFGPDVPRAVYVRLEARDAAGNIARVDSPDPVKIDLSRPTARIIDVETIPAAK